MKLGGERDGIELKPEHHVYKSLMTATRIDDAVTQVEDSYLKFLEYERGQINDDALFNSYGDFAVALLLNADGMLPLKAQKLLALKTLELTNEAFDKKYTLNTFFIAPPKRGRKKDGTQSIMLFSVARKINSGLSHNAAYKIVADEFGKKKETVRRVWEKNKLKRKN